MTQKRNNLFWSIVVASYTLVILLSFLRIYVYHAYPIYYTEDEIPDMAAEVMGALNFLNL